MLKTLASILLLLGLVGGTLAQDSRIEMHARGSKAEFTCYASRCGDHGAMQRDLRNLEGNAQLRCNNRSFGSEASCRVARDEFELARQCYQEMCRRVDCTRRDASTGQCISGPFFSRR